VFGAGATRQVLFTADRLPAPRAYTLGAVHMVAPASEVESKALTLAKQIAGNAPLTIKAAKTAISAITTDNFDLLAQDEAFYAAADASADYAEGRKAFAEKRPPVFTGS